MTSMTRKLTILFTVAVALVPGVASASFPPAAPVPVTVGLGEQNFNTFQEDLFKDLGLRHARVVTPWDVALSPGDAAWLDEYLAGARAAGVDPLVSLGAAHPSACPAYPCILPTGAQFDRAFRAF